MPKFWIKGMFDISIQAHLACQLGMGLRHLSCGIDLIFYTPYPLFMGLPFMVPGAIIRSVLICDSYWYLGVHVLCWNWTRVQWKQKSTKEMPYLSTSSLAQRVYLNAFCQGHSPSSSFFILSQWVTGIDVSNDSFKVSWPYENWNKDICLSNIPRPPHPHPSQTSLVKSQHSLPFILYLQWNPGHHLLSK